ncbi:MAG: radical SAM protein [Lachnospiraceae bacterium]|nr:radical SAM protein [Lachnospiraceae bacterium]
MNLSNDFLAKEYENCRLCPRECDARRAGGALGMCSENSHLFVTRAALHMWEEPCISGSNGSGAVFFAGCPLKCVFCQNYEISRGKYGKEISVNRLAEIFLELQDKGANNINLVTPTHYVPHIVTAASRAREKGFKIPFVYNTSGYEKPETLEQLRGIVDVFLPDFKYISSDTAALFSKAPDYPEVAMKAVDKMVEMAGAASFDNTTGIIKKGVIVRILVLPAHTNEAIKIIRYLHEKYADNIYLSIMSQYTPLAGIIPEGPEYDCLRRSLTKREYNKVINAALDMGVTNAFFQEGEVNKDSFIPPFDLEGV